MPAPTADSDSTSASGSDSDPSSRRRAALKRAALCAIALLAAAGCASSRPNAGTPSSATQPAMSKESASVGTTTPATTTTTTNNNTTTSRAEAAPDPAPAAKPAPAVRPVETFDMVWTTVRDQHFDKTLNGVDWDAVRVEFEPKARAAASQRELRAVLGEMLALLGQSHFGIIPSEEVDASPTVETQRELADASMPAERDASMPAERDASMPAERDASMPAERDASMPAERDASAEPATDATAAPAGGGPGIAGLDITIVEGVPTVTRVTAGLSAARAGVLVGWQLVSIDGREIETLLAPLRESLAHEQNPDSPHARQLRMMLAASSSQLVSGSAGERKRVVFRDASGAEQAVTIGFEPAPLGSSGFGNLAPFPIEVESRVVEIPIEGGKAVKIGYLAFNIWMTGVTEALDKGVDLIRSCDGVVIDLRGNPGGIGAMSMGVASHFVSEPISLGSMIGRDTTLAFNVTPRKVSAAGKRVRPISKPLAILLDVRSASTSEVFAGGLQSVGRARIFGEASAGMALPARAVELPNGDVLMHAIADFTTSTGVRLEGKGVIPDAPVSLTRSGLNKGIDEVLESASSWIREQTLAARAAKPAADATPAPRLKPRERAAMRAAEREAKAAAAVASESP
jgi:carboxyl-terminal processing protease